MPYIGKSPSFGVRNRFVYVADASDTSVSGADANGATLTFSDGAYVDVYLNGVLLKPTTDYNTNTANTIAGLSSLSANDEVTVVVYDIFTVADTVSASSGGTFGGDIVFGGNVSGLDVNGTEIILDADGDTSITADTDDRIDFKVGGSDRMHLDGNGKVGIGINTVALDGGGIHLGDDRYVGFGDGNGTRADFQIGYDATNTRLEFIAGTGSDAQDAIFTTGGRFSIGTTNATARINVQFAHSASEQGIRITPDSTTATMIRFDNSSGTEVGTITSSGSSTAYNTSSDYRLKENVSYDWDATSRLKQLKPARFNWIDDDTNTLVDGFLAHEVSSIVPESITGDKDATQDIGTIKNSEGVVVNEGVPKGSTDAENGETWTKTGTGNVYQSIDQSKLVPLLVKTIQELEARVTALESK